MKEEGREERVLYSLSRGERRPVFIKEATAMFSGLNTPVFTPSGTCNPLPLLIRPRQLFTFVKF